MKHLRTLLIGIFFLLGIPASLIAKELSPLELISGFSSLRQIWDVELFVRYSAGAILWTVWISGAMSVLIQATSLKRHGIIEPSDHVLTKAAATFVLALWLFTTHSTSKGLSGEYESKSSQVEILITKQEPQNGYQTFMPSAFAIMALLSIIESSHRRKLQLSLSGMFDEPASRASRLYWTQLKFRASNGSLSTETRLHIPKPTCVLSKMNEQGAVACVSESGMSESAVLTIPIGKDGKDTVLLSIGESDQIAVQSPDEECADEFVLYLNSFLVSSFAQPRAIVRSGSETSNIHISQSDSGWKIEPGGVSFSPFVLRNQEAEMVRFLQNDLLKPLVRKPVSFDVHRTSDWKICVRIMGPVEIADSRWETLRFERSKSAELLTWLVMHRDRPTRIAARTALWEVSIEDSTFNNVVSGVRKVINQDGTNLLGRENNDVFRIGSEVVTDVEILEAAIEKAKREGGEEEFSNLRDALDLVRDLPFAGEDYVWADTEGITSNVVLTIITGSLMLSDFYMSKKDLNGVFWATGQGLKALRGHEALIALRMKAHAQDRNISGINSEWLAYERLRIADDHFLDRESNEIAKLRESLLAGI